MRNCAACSSIWLLDCLTSSALLRAWYKDVATSKVTITSKQSPASSVIFHWIERRLNGMG